MSTSYTARAYRNPGRKGFVIAFRHPLKSERGRPGRKSCKGLGTEDEVQAKSLECELNALLARAELHSLAGRDEAARIFDPRVVALFYEDLDPAPGSHRALRDHLIPLPTRRDGYERSLLIGITGAGKSTLLRRLAGTDGERDRFPSTSVNRTTTCEVEIITGRDQYSAVVTFLSRHQTQQEVIESLSAAVLKAIEGAPDAAVATEFLEQSDQRFRLKYVLGDVAEPPAAEADAFTFDIAANEDAPRRAAAATSEFIGTTVAKLREIAAEARAEIEEVLGPLDHLQGDAYDFALDEMQQVAEQSDAFLDLVGEVMEEIGERFAAVTVGSFAKSQTGWPDAWTITLSAARRGEFLDAVRWFSGTSKESWGSLLTPLVTGVRVQGPFRPAWVPDGADYRHVFVDTEGLLHAKTTTEVPSELTSLFKDVDTILLVESALNALHSPSASKVFEAVASTGYTSKFALLFTHMDMVTGDNLTTPASKREHVFGGARNVLDNQLARNVSRDAARLLADQLTSNTFYFAYLDPNRYPAATKAQVERFETQLGRDLWRLCQHLAARTAPRALEPALPAYSFESLGLAVREASLSFQEVWEARLGYRRVENVGTAPWQSVKAMSRRYAEGWFDGYWLRPIDTLLSITRNVLTRFLETPLRWDGKPVTDEQKAAIVDRLKQVVNETLTDLSKTRLWRMPQPDWQRAYGLSGSGSTYVRRQRVRDIFQHQVPVPESVSDRWAQQWVDEIKRVLNQAIDTVRAEQEPRPTGLPAERELVSA